MNDANLAKEKLRTSTEELRVKRELTKEKDEQLAAARERAKRLAGKAIEASSRPRSTILYFSIGTLRGSSFEGGIS